MFDLRVHFGVEAQRILRCSVPQIEEMIASLKVVPLT